MSATPGPGASPSIASIAGHVLATCQGVSLERTPDELFLAYNPYHRFATGIPLISFTESDAPHDQTSNLGRGGLFRLNASVPSDWFEERFADAPAHDFEAIDVITPHPVFGWKGWISVLNPSRATLDVLKPLLRAQYDRAASLFAERLRRESA